MLNVVLESSDNVSESQFSHSTHGDGSVFTETGDAAAHSRASPDTSPLPLFPLLYSDSTAPKGSKDREWFSGRVVEIMGEKFKCQILTMRDLVFSSPRVRT